MNFIVDLEVYPFHIMFSFGESDKKLFKLLKKLGIKKKEYKLMVMDSQGKYMMFTGKSSIIRMPKKPKTPEQLGTLQHEILHATIEIMRTVGMPLSETSEEAYTYLQGYITKKVWEKLGFKK